MKSRYEQLRHPHQRRQFALFRSSAAVALAAVLFAGAVHLPPGAVPGAQVGIEFDGYLPPAAEAPEASAPNHVFESAGTDAQYPHQYDGQPGVF